MLFDAVTVLLSDRGAGEAEQVNDLVARDVSVLPFPISNATDPSFVGDVFPRCDDSPAGSGPGSDPAQLPPRATLRLSVTLFVVLLQVKADHNIVQTIFQIWL